ncbi:hypothetical protein ZHAS_00006399 [Anopheles sinensis]|uniref:Uncharacterized protein n=1 Tax=Anopheles sinensis TaxID=74873 RepID=A0A084VM81_ANOSI|nr:hypothetical protein ZHAS_00006399 [Anopheles sinensis]
MRLTVLICLYLTFLEASVGSLIYPERALTQLLMAQGRVVTVNELIAAGESIGLPSSSGITKRTVDSDVPANADVETEMTQLRKVKRKLATKKPVKRLVNNRASSRVKPAKNSPTEK